MIHLAGYAATSEALLAISRSATLSSGTGQNAVMLPTLLPFLMRRPSLEEAMAFGALH
jgi:hypothetical protein